MGTIYFGPYHEEIDTYAHEGFSARVLPDGGETSTFGGEYGWDGHVGYRARCDCGWSGSTVWPVSDPDLMESEEADAEWMREHIGPLVQRARVSVWPEWQRRTARWAGRVAEQVAAGRYRDAADVLMAMRGDLDARLRTVTDLAETAARAGGEPR